VWCSDDFSLRGLQAQHPPDLSFVNFFAGEGKTKIRVRLTKSMLMLLYFVAGQKNKSKRAIVREAIHEYFAKNT